MIPRSRGEGRSAAPSHESNSASSAIVVAEPLADTKKEDSTGLAATLVLSGNAAEEILLADTVKMFTCGLRGPHFAALSSPTRQKPLESLESHSFQSMAMSVRGTGWS